MDNQDYVQTPQESTTVKVKAEYSILDTVFAWISIIIGFFFAKSFPIRENTFGALICFVVLFVFGAIYFKCSKIDLTRKSCLIFAISILFSIGFVTGANKVIQAFLFVFMVALFLYWMYFSAGLTGNRVFGDNLISHFLYSLFVLPFTSFTHFFSGLVIRDKGGVGKK